MSCSVKRSDNGLITEVVLENGQPSVLFNKINSNIFIPDSEVALNIYSNSYSEEFENTEPELLYRDVEGNVSPSLERIILNSTDGAIELGFSEDGVEFTPIASFDTKGSEQSKMYSSLIREGILSADKVVDSDGQSFLSGKGSLDRTKDVSAQIAKEKIQEELPLIVTTRKDGAIKVETDSDFITVELKSGETITVSNEELPETLERKDLEDRPNLILQTKNFINRSFKKGAKKPVDKTVLHLNNLKSFLNSLGFSSTTMESYSKAFKTRHGKDPDVSALIDLANRVVAIAEGGNQAELMGEEVAHLAVETYNDRGSILGAITDIHLTPEYNEWADVYRTKYQEQYEGLELEEAVRKEILGKVINNAISKNSAISEEALTIWGRIVNYVKSIFKPAHRRALDNLSNQISKDILSNNLSAFSLDNLKGEGVFYSLNNEKTTEAINGAIKVLNTLSKKVKGSDRVAISARLKEIDNTATKLAELEQINNIQKTITTNLRIIDSKIQSNDPDVTIDEFDAGTFNTIQQQLIPQVGEYINFIQRNLATMTPSEKSLAEALKKDLEKLSNKVTEMSNSVKEGISERFNTVVEATAEENNLTGKEKSRFMQLFEGLQKEVTSLSAKFGIMSYSSSPLKGLVGDIVQRMYTKVNFQVQQRLNPTLKKIYDNGLQKEQRNTILRNDEGGQTYYFDNGLRKDLMEASELNEMGAFLRTLKPDLTEEQAKQHVKNKTVSEVLDEEADVVAYEKSLEKWKEENYERRMLDSYYTEKKALQKEANIADASTYELNGLNAQIQDILSYAKDETTGRTDKSRLTPSQKIALDSLYRAKEVKKSAIDQAGMVYEGLRIAKWEDLTEEEKSKVPFKDNAYLNATIEKTKEKSFTVLKDGVELDALSPDARIALDMFNMSMVMRLRAEKEGKSFDREVSQEFITEVERLESLGEYKKAYDFAVSNSSIGFTDAYYDKMHEETTANYLEDARAEIQAMPNGSKKDTKLALLADLSEVMTRHREIRKQYRKLGDSTEVDANDMGEPTRKVVIKLEEDIALKKRALAIKNLTERPKDPLTTRDVSQVFVAMQKESGEEMFDFAKEHMTEDNKNSLSNFDKYLRDNLINGINTEVDEKFEEFIQEQYDKEKISTNDTAEVTYNKLRNNYAQQRLASYAYSYKIEDFTALLEEAEKGNLKVSSLFTRQENFPVLQYAKLNVDYEWAESLTQLNPHYMDVHGKVMPKFSKYRDERFFSKYGISDAEYVKAKGDVTNMTAKQNQKAFEMLKEIVGFNKTINENTSDNVDIYLRPQVSRNTYEKAKSSVTSLNPKQIGADVKDGLLDSISFREDEKEYGEIENGKALAGGGIKVPPRMFQNKLESPEMLTEDVLFAGALSVKESYLYKGRLENMDKVGLVINHAKNSKFEDKGFGKKNITKEGEVSRVFKDLVEYADDHFYGIKQTRQLEFNVGGRTVDLTKVVSNLQKLSSKTNLILNPFVSATSLTTGLYNNMEGWIVGDDMSGASYKLAMSSLLTDIGKYLPDSAKVNRVSRLNTRMEGFGLVDVTGKVENSKDTDLERNSLKVSHLMDRLANLPVVPRVLYTVLKDTRFVGDKFLNYNQFVTQEKNKNEKISKTEINSLWKTFENNSFDNFLDDKDGVMKPNERFLAIEDYDAEVFEKYVLSIASKTKQIVQAVDGQLNEADRVMAQRDVALNVLMQHKGWLPINIYRMFRGEHFNFAQGKFEQGHYRTAFVVAYEMMKRLRNPSTMKEYYQDLSRGDKKNLKRVTVHSAMLMSALLAVLSLNASDDDDDSFLEDFVHYIMYRTYGEIGSITPMGMYRSMKDTAKQPFVLLSSYEKWTDIPMSVFSSEEGAFVSSLTKGTPLKRIDQLQDLSATTATWKKFNDDNIALINYFEGED